MTKTIYNDDGKAIGVNVDGKISWYYSDGSAGGDNGGYFMDRMEFLRFNGLM